MESGVGASATRFFGRDGNMTSKEKVLEIYSDARVWIMNSGTTYKKFYIHYWTPRSKWENLARYKKTEEEAWEAAWNYIQEDMIRKLEA